MTRLVLASASPARLSLLVSAGITPAVLVSDVDEEALAETLHPITVAELCAELARAKARDVSTRLDADDDDVVIGCDSMLEIDGIAYGKPADAAQARERWLAWSGRSGILHTGHWLIRPSTGQEVGRVASTIVYNASPTEQEIDAYIATGEPMRVAGGFTLDGLGAPFVERIEGDPSNVIGLSLPLVRLLLSDLGVVWTDLWDR